MYCTLLPSRCAQVVYCNITAEPCRHFGPVKSTKRYLFKENKYSSLFNGYYSLLPRVSDIVFVKIFRYTCEKYYEVTHGLNERFFLVTNLIRDLDRKSIVLFPMCHSRENLRCLLLYIITMIYSLTSTTAGPISRGPCLQALAPLLTVLR